MISWYQFLMAWYHDINSWWHNIMNYQTSCLCYLPKPKAEADNWDLGIDNSWYHAQTHSITANCRLSSVAGKNYCRKRALGYSIIFFIFHWGHFNASRKSHKSTHSWGLQFTHQIIEDVPLMNMNGNQCLELCPDYFGEFFGGLLDEHVQQF